MDTLRGRKSVGSVGTCSLRRSKTPKCMTPATKPKQLCRTWVQNRVLLQSHIRTCGQIRILGCVCVILYELRCGHNWTPGPFPSHWSKRRDVEFEASNVWRRWGGGEEDVEKGEGGADEAAADVPADMADIELDEDRLFGGVTLLDFEPSLAPRALLVVTDVDSDVVFFFLPKKKKKPIFARRREQRWRPATGYRWRRES